MANREDDLIGLDGDGLILVIKWGEFLRFWVDGAGAFLQNDARDIAFIVNEDLFWAPGVIDGDSFFESLSDLVFGSWHRLAGFKAIHANALRAES